MFDLFLIYCIILTMLKKNEILQIINSAAAQLSSAQLSSSIILNFLKFYVYLLIIKTIIFILSSYLIKSFIQLNVFIHIFIYKIFLGKIKTSITV